MFEGALGLICAVVMSLKLLVYSPLSLRFGGGFERWVLQVTSRLKRLGVSSEIVCTESTVGDRSRISAETVDRTLRQASVKYSEVPYIPFSMFGSNSPIPRGRWLKEILAKDYDILYFPNAYAFQDLLVSFLRQVRDRPVISGQHAVLFQESRFHDLYVNMITKNLSSRYDACHVLNSQDMRVLKMWGMARIYFIPIGIDTQKFSPRRHEEKRKKFKVLFVGRLTKQKGIDILCQSIGIINEDANLQRNVQFLVVGSGAMEPLVKEVTKKWRNVQHFNWVSDKDLAEIYRCCDVLVMPSRRETFGIVALEAQACGLPVIASDIPGPNDILVDHVTGRLVSPNDSISMALAVGAYYRAWCNDYEAFRAECLNSRRNVLKRFNWEIIINKIHSMLLETYDDFAKIAR
jgi:glycosyltransferase involved in cell wall biosynthesis